MQSIHSETQVFKNTELPFGSKKAVLVLALVLFLVTTGIALYYGKLIAPIKQRETIPAEFAKSRSSVDFIARTRFGQNTLRLPILPVLDNVVADKTSLHTENGELLFMENLGISVSGGEVIAPSWSLSVSGSIESAKISGQELLVSISQSFSGVCPVSLAAIRGVDVSVPCTDIYTNSVSGGDTIYSVLAVGIYDGNLKNQVSFLGADGDTQVYLSESGVLVVQNLVSTNSRDYYNFIMQKGAEFLTPEILIKIQKLETYDLSSEAKMAEMEVAIRKHYEGLSTSAKSRFLERYSILLSDFLNQADAPSNSIVAFLSPDLVLGDTYFTDGHVVQGGIHQNKGVFFALTVENALGTSNYTNAVLYKLDYGMGKYEIADFPEAISFSEGWLFASKSGKITALKLNELSLHPVEISDNSAVAGFPDHFLVLRQEGGATEVSLYTLEGGTEEMSKIAINQPWNEVLPRLGSGSKSTEGLLYMPGVNQDFILSSNDERLAILGTIVYTNSQNSYFGRNYLYISGDKVYIMDLGTRDIIEYSGAGR